MARDVGRVDVRTVFRVLSLAVFFVGGCDPSVRILVVPDASDAGLDPSTDGSAPTDGGGGADGAPSIPKDGATDGAGPVDAGSPAFGEADFQDVYFLACLPQVAAGEAERAFRFRLDIRYTHADRKLTFAPPKAVRVSALTMDDTLDVGASGGAGELGPQGQFDVTFGSMTIAAEANAFTGGPVGLDAVALRRGYLRRPGRSCAELEGRIVSPVVQTLETLGNAYEDVCILQRVDGTGSVVPTLSANDFRCP